MSKRRRKRNVFIRPPADNSAPRKPAKAASGSEPTLDRPNWKSITIIVLALIIMPLVGILITEISASTLHAFFWKRTDCKILTSSVTAENLRPQLTIRYAFEFKGVWHTNDTYRLGHAGFSKFSDAYQAALEYRVGDEHKCLVNPAFPAEATLRAPRLINGLSGLLLFFMFVGAGGLLHNLNPSRQLPLWYELPLGLIFLSIPLIFSIGLSMPAYQSWKSASWEKVPCTVLGTYSEKSSNRKSTTYVTYSYEKNGQKWLSNQYGVDRLPNNYEPKDESSCFVNPDTPYEALIRRYSNSSGWLALFPLFICGLFLKSWWKSRRP